MPIQILRHGPLTRLVLVVLCCVFPTLAMAQELAKSIRLAADNDYFNFWLPPRERSDDNYTHGMRIEWDIARSPRLIRRFACPSGASCGTTIEVGQEIYTPEIDAPWPIPGERPYAGWLYARVAVRGGRSNTLRSLEGTIGLTGPPSLGESTQNGFHRLIPEFRTPLGWEYQLPSELAFALRASQSWRGRPGHGGGREWVDVIPTLSAGVGTLRTAAAGGVRVRAAAPLRHPWLRSEGARFSPYGFVGVRGEAVARDLFLDGTAFRDSITVTRKALVTEWERGVGVHLARFALEYRAVTRSEEYASARDRHTYSSIVAAWTLR
jgi:lipid A 3-O-deacylase